jgi:homoserine/homoserine lactone efflux protein
MSWERVGLFILVETMLCLTPGPAVMLILSQALARGFGASTWSAFGILAGNTVYFVISATWLGALLLASWPVFQAIRWLGAAWLVWLGVTTALGRSSILSIGPAAGPVPPRFRLVLNGFLLQAANPKALLFFAALLPQFIDPALPVVSQVAVLALLSVVIELAVLSLYGAAAGHALRFAREPRYARATNVLAGLLLLTAGISIAAFQRV